MSLWFSSSFGVPPVTMFSWPFSYNPGVLPPFYSSLLSAWQSLNGSFSPSHNSLAFGVGLPLVCTPVAGMSTKSCYLYLLSENMVQPHCVDKFSFTFGPLDWPAAWCPLSFLDVDRQVTDLNWKLAHNMLYTAQRLASFGLPVPLPCFCGSPMESLGHLFFYCPLATMFCPGCNLCLVFLSCVRPFWCVMSASALVRTNCAPPPVSLSLSLSSGSPVMTSVFAMSRQAP